MSSNTYKISQARRIYNRRGISTLARSITIFLYFRSILPLKAIFRKKTNSIKYNTVANPYKVLWIQPSPVLRIQGDFQQSDIGRIIGGGWDLKAYPIDQLQKYNLVQLHFEEGYSWDEIIEDRLIPIIEEEGEFDGYTTKKGIRTRYKKIEKLCENIQREGYKSYKELGESPLALNHVGVNIGRDGEFFFSGSGIHRLSIAKCLEIDEIPAQVWVRHERWQEVRDQVAGTGEVPEEYTGHPDLQDLV